MPLELLPTWLDLLVETHARHASELYPNVRRGLDERNATVNLTQAQIDAQAMVVTQVLEVIRVSGKKQGLWSDVPVTPLMAG